MDGDVWRLCTNRVFCLCFILYVPNVCVRELKTRIWNAMTTKHTEKQHTHIKPSLFSHKVACCALFIARFIMHSSKAVFVGGLVCFKPNQFCFRLFILCIRHDWCENKAHHIVHILFFTRNFFPFLVFFHFERWSNLCLQQVNQHIEKNKVLKKICEKPNEMNNAK